MSRFKKYFVIIFFTLFVVGNMTAIATATVTPMAYCGSGHDGTSMEEVLESTTHNQVAAMEHDGTKTTKHYNSTDESSDGPDCFDCDGSLCHTQSLVPIHAALSIYDSTGTLHIEKDLNLKQIFLTRIPQPPKQLS